MSEILKKTITQLPQILAKNAPSMMQRMVVAMQSAIAADTQPGASSYGALLLKMSSDDLVREFDLAIRASMDALQQGPGGLAAFGLGLSIEPLDEAATVDDADFHSSAVLFDKLCAKADALGVDGLRTYGKDLFLAAFNDALAKSRIEPADAQKLVSFGRKALNDELLKLYEKLDALA
ncbi:MAG: hypothetical protein ABI907_13330 [Ramlibacter sp.]